MTGPSPGISWVEADRASLDTRGGIRASLSAALPWLAITAAFVHALAVSWRKWGNLVIDTGRELDLPRRLAEGQLLYRDAHFNYGPLAPYVNSLLYRLFGVHLDVLVCAGIVSAALMCLGLYRLARSFVPRWASATVVIAFLYLCAFAHLYAPAIFNFVLPYTFSATYGILAAIWSLVFLIRHIRTGRRSSFLLSVLFLALTSLSKLEPLAPAVAAHIVFFTSMLFARSSLRRVYLAGYGAIAVVVLGVYGVLTLIVGPGLWRENLAGVINPGSRKFVLGVMGLGDLGTSLKAIGLSMLLLAATLLVAWFTARWLSRRPAPAAAAWAVVAAVSLGTFLVYRQWQLHVHFRALPLVMISTLVALAAVYHRQPDRRSEWLAHALLWVFGFACLLRIPLNTKPHHYGFYLLPAGLVCIAVFVYDYGPRLNGAGPWPTRVFGAAGIGLLTASSTLAFADSKEQYALHTYELETARGHLRIFNELGLLGPAVHVLSRFPPTTRVATVPQGAGIRYFAGLREGDSMSHYLPMEVFGPEADARLLLHWKRNPPDLVTWVGIPLTEFGSEGFGKDYARRSMAWMLEEYVPVTNPYAGIVLLEYKRKRHAGGKPLDLFPSPEPQLTRETITGTVLESFSASGAVFLRLQTGTSKLWVAVPETEVSPGSQITIYDAQPGPAEELGFRRRFGRVLWGNLRPLNRAHPVREAHGGIVASPVPASAAPVSRAEGPDGRTVAEVFAERGELQNRQVAVRGTVVKFLSGIMGRNWMHVKDGSGSPEERDDDLVVTTSDTARIGEVVLVRGTIHLGRDFGLGYVYPVLLEDGRISR